MLARLRRRLRPVNMPAGLTVDVKVLELAGKHHIAVARLGGITLRGRRAEDATGAVRNLFWRMGGTTGGSEDDEAILAIDLALEGKQLDAQLEALGDGSDQAAG